MLAYDDQLFSPPAPLARVVLRNRNTGATLADVPMLIDSGADVTLIPRSSADLIGVDVAPGEVYELVSFDGNLTTAQVVELDLIFLRRTFKGRFLLTSQEWGILGRDILNHLILLLDGPQLIWDESKSTSK